MPRTITIILNQKAGGQKHSALLSGLTEVFAAHGAEARVREVDGGGTIAQIVREAVEAGHFAVAAAGGDGTVSAVAAQLVHSECALGVLPLGTLNHFAKDLGIPLDPLEAAAVIATGQVRVVDAGEVNGRVFVNNSSLGLYPHLVKGREAGQRLGRSKWTALCWAALVVLRRNPMLRVCITTVDGQEVTRRTPLVFVGNNAYRMRGFEIGSRSALDQGKLCVYVAHGESAGSLVRTALGALLGIIREGKDFDSFSTCALEIRPHRKSVAVSADGEVCAMEPPLQYRILPGALRVMTPGKG